MNFDQDLLQFQANRLKPTNTRVTTHLGKQFIEKRNEEGFSQDVEYTGPHAAGYCIDNDPDLTYATVRPGLLLSGQDVAATYDLLKSAKVTHIVNLASYVKNMFPDDFTYLQLTIADMPDQNILSYLDEIHNFISAAIKDDGVVLVHCNAGVSRAPTVVATYLMRTEKIRRNDALFQIQALRFVFPNEGFMNQMTVFEKQLGIS